MSDSSAIAPAAPARKRAGWALFVLGAWSLGSVVMFCIAALNFTTIDRLLDESTSAPFREHLAELGRPALRDLLRYLSSELNRLYFFAWNVAQLVLGAALLALCRPAPARVRLGIWLMTLSVLVMLVPLTPWITALGRSLDFLPRDPPPPQLREFWTLHAAYTVLDLAKLGVGVAVAAGISWRARPEAA